MAQSIELLSRRWLLTLLGVAISAGLLVWAAIRLDWQAVAAALAGSQLLPWVPLAVASYLAGHLLRGVRCRLLLADSGLSVATASNLVVIGYAVNNILPARAGELARAAMITDRTGLPFPAALTVAVVERLLDGLAIVLLLLLGVFAVLTGDPPAAGLPSWMQHTLWIAIGVFGTGTGVVALLVWFPDVFRALAARFSARMQTRTQALLVRFTAQITAAVSVLARPHMTLRLGILSLAIWLLEAGMFLAVLPALGLRGELGWALMAMGVTNLGLLVPSTPGFVGPFHFFCMQTMIALGIAPAASFAYAVMVHATFYVPITIWGLLALFVYGVEFARLRTITRAASRLPPVSSASQLEVVETVSAISLPARPARLLESVIGAFLFPASDLLSRLPEPERRVVTGDVMTFVSGQIQALPNRLRLLFRLGLTLFGLAVRLRHPLGLHALPAERRARIVEAWAFGRWSAPRKLFRLVRSTALLAFYDHPAVAALLDGSPTAQSRLQQVRP